MALQSPVRSDAPFSAINTTPLIDVLLVLLIMLVITIPVATHSLDIDLPSTPGHSKVDPDVNRLTVTADDRIVWNGTPISQAELAANLRASVAMRPEPALQYRPEPEASYDVSARVIGIVKQSQVTNFGFVGNEQFSQFGKTPNGK